jgi:hypothetical protein
LLMPDLLKRNLIIEFVKCNNFIAFFKIQIFFGSMKFLKSIFRACTAVLKMLILLKRSLVI